LLALLTALVPVGAKADWYILLPKKPLPKREVHKLPSFNLKNKKKVKPKPYSVEVRKIIAPDFTLPLSGAERVSNREFLGRTTVIFFVDELFSPYAEELVAKLRKSNLKGVRFVVVSVNDADFAQVKTFKELMGVSGNRLLVSADSYVYKLFKERIGKLGVPSVVVIDKYGFIRFFSPQIKKKGSDELIAQLGEIVKTLNRV